MDNSDYYIKNIGRKSPTVDNQISIGVNNYIQANIKKKNQSSRNGALKSNTQSLKTQ